MKIRFLSFFLNLALVSIGATQTSTSIYSREYGTIDCLGAIPAEALSSCPQARSVVDILQQPTVTRANLTYVDRLVRGYPDDMALKFLRVQLALRLNTSRPWIMPASRTDSQGVERTLHAYWKYWIDASAYPEHIGISADMYMNLPPYLTQELQDLVGLAFSRSTASDAEKCFFSDYGIHVNYIAGPRRAIDDLRKAHPKLWQLDLMKVCRLRCGALDHSADQHFRLTHPDKAKQYAQAFALAKKLVVAHPDCPFAWMLAGVTAKDVGEKVYARECFLKYLSNPDPGRLGSQRILDAKELLKRLTQSK